MNGFTALREMCDAHLFSLEEGKVNLTFGCLSDFTRGERSILAPYPYENWLTLDHGVLDEGMDGPFTVHGGVNTGIFISYALPDGYYTLSFM